MAGHPGVIGLDEVVADEAVQPRANGLDAAHVEEMAGWLLADPGRDLPPVVVYADPDTNDHVLSEGFHRLAAYRRAGREAIPCEVRDGDRAAARLNAAASNRGHGLKRSNEDKNNAVRIVLTLKPDWTQDAIAEFVGVDQKTVGDVKADLAAIAAAKGEIRKSLNSKPKHGASKRGPKPTKEDKAAAVAEALKVDPGRSDDSVAAELRCKSALVKRIRRTLVKEGLLPEPAVEPTPEQNSSARADTADPRCPGHVREAVASRAEWDRCLSDLRSAARRLGGLCWGHGAGYLRTLRVGDEPVVREAAVRRADGGAREEWVSDFLSWVITAVSKARPDRVCLGCFGAGCRGCRMLGFLPAAGDLKPVIDHTPDLPADAWDGE